MFYYMDDFLFIGPPNTDEVARALSLALCVLQYLGGLVAEYWTEDPSSQLSFLGIMIATTAAFRK